LPDSLEQDAIRLESMLPKVMRFLFRHEVTDPLSHLSVAQLRMVRSLSSGPRIAADLSQEHSLTPSAISQATHRLEKMGLIVRETDEQDRRVRRLALSPAGEKLMRERQEIRVRRAQAALSQLPDAHRHRLISTLHELIEGLGPALGPVSEPKSLVAELEQAMPPIPPFEATTDLIDATNR